MTKQIICPQCGSKLEPVRQSSNSPLNRDQFESCMAGDYFCKICPDNNRGESGMCYWWEKELLDSIEFTI